MGTADTTCGRAFGPTPIGARSSNISRRCNVANRGRAALGQLAAPERSIQSHDAIVIGAGPAGLAASRELTRAGVGHVVLERGDTIAHTWTRLYEGLVLHTGKHFSALPGLRFPASTPLFPTRLDLVGYLSQYADTFRVPVQTNACVEQVDRAEGEWIVRVKDSLPRRAKALVVATGIVSNPYVPMFSNRAAFSGRVMHSVEYVRPDPFTKQRVLVVGAGNSGGEISAELAAAGADVTVAIRSGARVMPRQILGVPVQYAGVALGLLPAPVTRGVIALASRVSGRLRGPSPLPRPTDSSCAVVPLIGFHLVDELKSGRIQLRRGISRFTPRGVRFVDGLEEDFDCVVLATGYRAAVGMLTAHVTIDRCGFASRAGRVRSTDRPDLYFVGHNYDASGGLRNIARDARLTAKLIATRLRGNGRK